MLKNQQPEQPRFSTAHEIRFIEHLGLSQFGSVSVLLDRQSLLKRYVKAAHKRSDWAGIDKDIVLSTAVKLLKEVSK